MESSIIQQITIESLISLIKLLINKGRVICYYQRDNVFSRTVGSTQTLLPSWFRSRLRAQTVTLTPATCSKDTAIDFVMQGIGGSMILLGPLVASFMDPSHPSRPMENSYRSGPYNIGFRFDPKVPNDIDMLAVAAPQRTPPNLLGFFYNHNSNPFSSVLGSQPKVAINGPDFSTNRSCPSITNNFPYISINLFIEADNSPWRREGRWRIPSLLWIRFEISRRSSRVLVKQTISILFLRLFHFNSAVACFICFL